MISFTMILCIIFGSNMVRTRTEPEHYVQAYLVLVLPGLNMNMMFVFRFGSKCAEHEPNRTVASLAVWLVLGPKSCKNVYYRSRKLGGGSGGKVY